MQTNCHLFYQRFSKKDIELLDISEIITQIERIDYNPKIQNIGPLKEIVTEFFSDNGFILNTTLGHSNLTINGIKHKTGLAIQTGNVARFYADILKLEWLFKEKKINNAVYVCFSKESARDSYSSNLIDVERAIRETIFFDKIINIPILFIALDFV